METLGRGNSDAHHRRRRGDPEPLSSARTWWAQARVALILLLVLALCLAVSARSNGGRPSAHRTDQILAASTRGRHRVSRHPRRPLFRMLFVGASVTSGVGAESPADAYPQKVAAGVRRRVGRVRVTVVAQSGAQVTRAMRWRFPVHQNVVVVHLITNDFLHGTPLSLYSIDLDRVLHRLRRGSPHATLICLGAWANPSTVNRSGLGPGLYDLMAKEDCQGFGGHFEPLRGIFMKPGMHDPATLQIGPPLPHSLGILVRGRRVAFHPGDAGHEAIALVVYGELERTDALKRPPPAT